MNSKQRRARLRLKVPVETEFEYAMHAPEGRWIAEIHAIPGCVVYGATEAEAIESVRRLRREVLKQKAPNWRTGYRDYLPIQHDCNLLPPKDP